MLHISDLFNADNAMALIPLTKSELTDQKLCNNIFTWCFHKAKVVLYSPCKRTKNFSKKQACFNLFSDL